jgi:hypothetical protein
MIKLIGIEKRWTGPHGGLVWPHSGHLEREPTIAGIMFRRLTLRSATALVAARPMPPLFALLSWKLFS